MEAVCSARGQSANVGRRENAVNFRRIGNFAISTLHFLRKPPLHDGSVPETNVTPPAIKYAEAAKISKLRKPIVMASRTAPDAEITDAKPFTAQAKGIAAGILF